MTDSPISPVAHRLRFLCYRMMFLWRDEDSYLENVITTRQEVAALVDELLQSSPYTVDEEAELCWSVLMGYGIMIRDDHQVDEILKRSYHVLELSPSEHLRCQLMTYMYGETLDEQLLEEVLQTVGKWKKEDYLEEDNLMMGALTAMENNAQHYQVVEEMGVLNHGH